MLSTDPKLAASCAVAIYDRQAAEFARLYESVPFEDVHKGILDLLPDRPIRALDIGAGSGRDAAALADRGYNVTAVEPSAGLRAEGQRAHSGTRMVWLDDRLPALPSLNDQNACFDLVLVSAVWMHLEPPDREPALKRINELLAPGGLLVVTLRHGPPEAGRGIHSIPVEEVEGRARSLGLAYVRRIAEPDALKRKDISWTTLVFQKANG